MSKVLIQGGSSYNGVTGLWTYRYADVDGLHEITFTASRAPRIGDTIVDGALVDAVLPQSNQDKSRWETPPSDVWPVQGRTY